MAGIMLQKLNKFYHIIVMPIGVEILSMSKIIMNGVFGCASDCGVNIYYQDTDNIRLNYDDVDTVVNRYTKKCNKDLVGESLSQFHVDFPKKDGYKDVYGIESLFLGKKPYIDILEYVNDEGNTTHGQHVRMKGFPTSCIEYFAKENKMTVLYVYNELCDNKSIKIDLTNQNTKYVFRNTPEHNVKSLSYGDKGTTRTCQFISPPEHKLFIN